MRYWYGVCLRALHTHSVGPDHPLGGTCASSVVRSLAVLF